MISLSGLSTTPDVVSLSYLYEENLANHLHGATRQGMMNTYIAVYVDPRKNRMKVNDACSL